MGKQRPAQPTIARLTPHLGMGIVLLLFLILSTLHSIVVPITQGEDELAHYRYIGFIGQTGRLPTNYVEREQAWYRADWPPLYHLLVGWATSPLDTSRPHLKDVGESPRRRLVGEIFYPRLIIYTEDADWPWQDGILAWHVGRFISILFSGTALVFTYLTALELCGGARKPEHTAAGADSPISAVTALCRSPNLFATVATALLAFTPRYAFTSAMLGDDSLLVLLSALFIWLLLRVLRGDDRWGMYAGLGLLLGLSIATKYSTGLFPLAIIPVVWWRTRQVGWSRLQAAGRLGIAWFFTLLGSSWWFGWLGYYFNSIKDDGLILGLLNAILATGPDVSMRRVFDLFAGREFSGPIRPGAIAAGSFTEWLTYLFQTFWGVPVLEYDPVFPWAYLVVLAICLLAIVGLRHYWMIATAQERLILSLLILLVGLLLPFPVLRFFLTFNVLETGQGRHVLYPAAQAIPILLTIGWLTFFDRFVAGARVLRKRPGTGDLPLRLNKLATGDSYLVLLPLLLLIWSVFQLNYMASIYPTPLSVQTSTFKQSSIPQPLKHNFSPAIQFLGYDYQPDPEQAIINLTIFWKALEPVEENYRVQVQLVDPAGTPHFTWINHPLNGLYPTRAWDKGDIIRETLPLPLAAVPPNTYNIQIDLLREAENSSIGGEPFEIIHFTLGQEQPIPQASKLTGRIEYRLWVTDKPVRQRQTLPLSWRSLESSASDAQPLEWALFGPDNRPRLPLVSSEATAIFMVGADWPSGDYRLGLVDQPLQTEPLLTVANELRTFAAPDYSNLPNWVLVEANFANQVELVGYQLPSRRVEAGGGIPLTLHWRSLAPVLGDYVVFDVLLDKEQQVYGGYDRLPREYYSTILWAENELVEDGFAVPVSSKAPPGIYTLQVGLYSVSSGEPVSLPLVQDGRFSAATSVTIGPIKVGSMPPDVTVSNPAPQVSLQQSFGNQIMLLGYDLTDTDGFAIQNRLSKAQNLKLTLYWQAQMSPVADYTTFAHLRNAANENVTQKDQPPTNGQYPTSLWDSGEIIVDEIILQLDGVAAGEYTPVIGLYDFATGARLPLENIPDNELRLESVILP